jgi:hypothetical protein
LQLSIKISFFFFLWINPFLIKASDSLSHIDSRSGVIIDFTTNAIEISDKRSAFEVKPLKKEKISEIIRIISSALSKYPVAFLKKYLKKIYVWEDLKINGARYGGAQSKSLGIIYIDFPDSLSSEKALRTVEICFHHEFMHILHLNNKKLANYKEWKTINGKDFRYSGSGDKAIKTNQASVEYKVEFHSQGFLYQYATSAFEEDFASFSEIFLDDSRQLWEIINSNTKLFDKMNRVVLFYNKLDPAFTLEFFKNQTKENYFK